MSEQKTYCINDQKVIHETLDSETILINLENGNYYSMNASGSFAWEWIVKHYSFEQIANAFSKKYQATPEEITQGLEGLIQFLSNEQLILETTPTEAIIDFQPVGIKEIFLVPQMEKYVDMQDMLLADPIHDVDEIGWPILKKE